MYATTTRRKSVTCDINVAHSGRPALECSFNSLWRHKAHFTHHTRDHSVLVGCASLLHLIKIARSSATPSSRTFEYDHNQSRAVVTYATNCRISAASCSRPIVLDNYVWNVWCRERANSVWKLEYLLASNKHTLAHLIWPHITYVPINRSVWWSK